jgi:hypothetical protein
MVLASSLTDPISVAEHEVKLTHIGPVFCARYGISNLQINNELLHGRHVAVGQGFFQAVIGFVYFL